MEGILAKILAKIFPEEPLMLFLEDEELLEESLKKPPQEFLEKFPKESLEKFRKKSK